MYKYPGKKLIDQNSSTLIQNTRSRLPKVFCIKGVLKNFAELAGKDLSVRISFLTKL